MSRLRHATIHLLVVLVLGVAAGAAWAWLAQPAEWELVEGGRLVMTEEAATAQFSVELVFVAIGVVVSLLWGAAVVRVLGLSWQSVVAVLLGSAVMAVVAWQVGHLLGPPPLDSLTGDEILADGAFERLEIDSLTAFLAWPIGALVGVLVFSWTSSPRAQERAMADSTPWVADTRS